MLMLMMLMLLTLMLLLLLDSNTKIWHASCNYGDDNDNAGDASVDNTADSDAYALPIISML